MNAKALFLGWARPDSVWSRWTKPVLFTQLEPNYSPDTVPDMTTPVDLRSVPDPTSPDKTAIIVNLPGADGVEVGLNLAKRGYFPVPLYNCTNGLVPAVPVHAIISRLVSGVDILQGLQFDPTAPPAFLLDSNRVKGLLPPTPGTFDNRWVVFPQDFPSATFLGSQQIRQVLLIQNGTQLDDDLAHVLVTWQKAGINLVNKDIANVGMPTPLTARLPSGFSLWYRALILLAIQQRRSNAGGFGAIIPIPSSGGG